MSTDEEDAQFVNDTLASLLNHPQSLNDQITALQHRVQALELEQAQRPYLTREHGRELAVVQEQLDRAIHRRDLFNQRYGVMMQHLTAALNAINLQQEPAQPVQAAEIPIQAATTVSFLHT